MSFLLNSDYLHVCVFYGSPYLLVTFHIEFVRIFNNKVIGIKTKGVWSNGLISSLRTLNMVY